MAREAEEAALRQIELEQALYNLPTVCLPLTVMDLGRSSKIQIARLLASVTDADGSRWTNQGCQTHHNV